MHLAKFTGLLCLKPNLLSLNLESNSSNSHQNEIKRQRMGIKPLHLGAFIPISKSCMMVKKLKQMGQENPTFKQEIALEMLKTRLMKIQMKTQRIRYLLRVSFFSFFGQQFFFFFSLCLARRIGIFVIVVGVDTYVRVWSIEIVD